MGFRLLPQAMADIETIAVYIKADNPGAAQRWLDELHRRFSALGTMPGMGVFRPEIGDGVRLLPFGSYLVLYREVPSGVDIVRVIHGRREQEGWV